MGVKSNKSSAGDVAAVRTRGLTQIADDTAELEKIAGISERLDDETRLRRRRFGVRSVLGGSSGVSAQLLGAATSTPQLGRTSASGGLLGGIYRGLFT